MHLEPFSKFHLVSLFLNSRCHSTLISSFAPRMTFIACAPDGLRSAQHTLSDLSALWLRLSLATSAEALFLLGGVRRRAGSLSLLMMPLPLFAPTLHCVPFLLLLGIQKGADLVVGRFADLHHLGSAILR